jgi:hypothetical protein
MKKEERVYQIDYCRYTTNSLLDALVKLDKDSELYLLIMLILRKRNCSEEYFSKESKLQLEREKSIQLEANRICFGYKNQEYFTEEEMINGYIIPKYEELSPEEKEIYDNEGE